jgi:hypothetical protein
MKEQRKVRRTLTRAPKAGTSGTMTSYWKTYSLLIPTVAGLSMLTCLHTLFILDEGIVGGYLDNLQKEQRSHQ